MSSLPADTRQYLIEQEVSRQTPDVQARYHELVAAGQEPQWALMCACRQAPRTRYSDRSFNDFQRQRMEKITPISRQRMLRLAKRAGISTQGKFYVGGLGGYTDPAALVSTIDDVKQVCKAKNLNADGGLTHRATPMDPPVPVPMAPDILAGYMREYQARDPALAERCRRSKKARRELQATIVAKHGSRRQRATVATPHSTAKSTGNLILTPDSTT